MFILGLTSKENGAFEGLLCVICLIYLLGQGVMIIILILVLHYMAAMIYH